jgi:hypothetical protein
VKLTQGPEGQIKQAIPERRQGMEKGSPQGPYLMAGRQEKGL